MPTLGTDTDADINTTATTLSFSHTVSSGTNICLVVRIGYWSAAARTVSGVTWNSVSLTQAAVADVSAGGDRAYIFYLDGPTPATANVVITWSGDNTKVGGANALNLSDVHQTTPVGTSAKANGNSGTASVNVTSAAGELVVDAVTCDDSGGTTHTVGAGQTAQYDRSQSGEGAFGSSETGAASVTMSWTFSPSRTWTTCAIPFKPPTTTKAPPPPPRRWRVWDRVRAA